jgi:diacylglycerol kinase
MLPDKNSFSIKSRIKSFGYAFSGLFRFIKTEHNARIHALATLLVITAGWWKSISKGQWTAVLFAFGLVWSAEAFNTCIEHLANVLSPDYDPRIKYVKDLSAGAVLVTAIVAAIIGCIIFIPKFF